MAETETERERRLRRLAKQAASVTLRERMRNKRIARVLLVFVCLVIAFSLGFFVRSQVAFVASLGFPVEGGLEATAGSGSSTKTLYNSLTARVETVEDLLAGGSMDELDLGQATPAVMKALMASLDDPYAAYFDAERYASYVKEASEHSYSGIGVLFAEYNGRAYVADVFAGSEADALGVQQGDFIEAIDGVSSADWTSTEVINELSREDGEQVVVTWMRPTSLDAQTGREFTTTLTCRSFHEENLTSEVDEGVGYLRLRQVSQNSAELVASAIGTLTADGARAFVLDVRDNPGGYLTQAVDIASLFLQSGVVVEVETVEGTSSKAVSGTTATMAPLVVIVDGYTAAAAEVLAAGLQGNQRATLVGQTTMGKGSVQVTRELSFGGGVRYTAAYYLTPLGAAINGVGVVPDVEVGSSDDEDLQLRIAMELARTMAEE